jgi:hypothetical protein
MWKVPVLLVYALWDRILGGGYMKIGLRLPQTGENRATRENIIHLAKEAEYAGFDSLWVLERLIWPVDPQNRYPETKDRKFPEDWQYIFDPLETLTFVAAITDKIALGTSIIDILFHTPVILARRFTTLDVFSKGRASFIRRHNGQFLFLPASSKVIISWNCAIEWAISCQFVCNILTVSRVSIKNCLKFRCLCQE